MLKGLKKIVSTALIAALTLLPTTSFPQILDEKSAEKAVELLQLGDMESAIPLLNSLANSGNATAQNAMGHLYEKGQNVDYSLENAHSWYLKSAEQGNPIGQHRLGELLMIQKIKNPGKESAFEWAMKSAEQSAADKEVAFEWYMKSAEQGFAPAQNAVGYMYDRGIGVEQNIGKAKFWYSKSSYQGYPIASYNYARMLDRVGGSNAAPNLYLLAAKQGHPTALNKWIIHLRDRFSDARVSGDEMSTAFRRAEYVKWLKYSAERGNTGAQLALEKLSNELAAEARAAAQANKLDGTDILIGLIMLGVAVAAMSPSNPDSNSDEAYRAEQARIQQRINTDLAIGFATNW